MNTLLNTQLETQSDRQPTISKQIEQKSTQALTIISSPSKTRAVKLAPSVEVGGSQFVVIAGPCSVESPEQFLETAMAARDSGAQILRGGIFKMRTDPKSFQGLGTEALGFLQSICREMGIALVSEVSDPRQIEELADTVEVFQVGTRNMFNYGLLEELGRQKKPVLLKRAFSALIDEWLLAAEYILKGGNQNVVLCERGIRTFENSTRNTLDLSAVPIIKAKSHLPIIVDPSHATGRRDLVAPMARAAIAAGCDGLLIEMHPNPALALSDADQALDFASYHQLMNEIKLMLPLFGKHL